MRGPYSRVDDDDFYGRGHGAGGGRDGFDGGFPHHDRPKLNFPSFDGTSDSLPWLTKCVAYFRGMRTMEEEKVWMAMMHLEGIAAEWYYALERDYGILTWPRFANFVNMRFGPPLRTNGLAELKDLRRTSTVDDYIRQFSLALCHCADLSMQHQVNLFTAGLGEPLRTDVELQAPSHLQTAMNLTRAYERRDTEVNNALRGMYRAPTTKTDASPAQQRPTMVTRPRFKRLTAEEMAAKRANGECYHCAEKYTADHKCNARGVFLIELDDDAEADTLADDLGVSLHALTGIDVGGTMKLHFRIGDTTLLALVDSGSTHTFIHETTASRLGLSVEPRPGLTVKVANGERVTSQGACPMLRVSIDAEDFDHTCYVLPLVGFDVVLGVQWLRSLGPVLWNFDALTMTLWRHGRTMTWTGVGGPTPRCNAIVGTQDLLPALLDSYADVFAEPRGLPPQRRQDHRIRLLPGTPPVAVRPYRYPQLLKDEIERQCEDMLQQGIIRECTSAFSSPVLLVKKADGSWRFCVDYRELNAQTVKDKFPIPVVDKLLAELHGAKFFTKLDLRSGYHQVCMHPDDVDKTAFLTHRGHFEFLVMPFGLTNAPSTFQSLMNDVLKPFIRKFVLVFFDDILIFSSSWAEHLQYIKQVLQVLQEHHLVLKRSKCSFGQESMAYLGHIISATGVAMDPAKVSTVVAWPQPRSLRALRGFLGLTGYYRKFIAGYGAMAAPLTSLLKREAFTWTEEATTAFTRLNQALIMAPLLQLPDFSERFIVDCDASDTELLVPYCTKGMAPLHSSVEWWRLTTRSCRPTSGS